MLPLSGPRSRASLPLLAAVLLLLCVIPSTSLPAGSKCPLHIDCAKEGRHFCKPGSSHCGPCLSPLEENQEGRCVVRKRHREHGKRPFYPDLDEEIDYLHSYIEKQEMTEITSPKKQPKHSAPVASQPDEKTPKMAASKHKQKAQVQPIASTPAPRTAPSNTSTAQPRATGLQGRGGPVVVPAPRNDRVIVIMISLCVVVGAVAVILATVCYVKLQRESRLSQKVDYPAYGGMGGAAAAAASTTTAMGDKTLAQSAQMFHYQHQKQQMLSMGNHKPEQKAVDAAEVTSDEEEVGGDFTVYECPGLAPTGEMEVKNPLFDDSTLHYQGNHK